MRLIDADAIQVFATSETLKHIITDLIDAQPTIDAVPVEFIRHWIHALNHGRRNGKVWAAMVLQALLDAWARAERKEE